MSKSDAAPKRLRRFVTIAATAAERDELERAAGGKARRGFSDHLYRTVDDARTLWGLPVDGYELTDQAKEHAAAQDAINVLEQGKLRAKGNG